MAATFFSPTMKLTEYAKSWDNDATRPLIETFAMSSDVMKVIPWVGLTGPIYLGFRQAALSESMGFRALNATPTEGAGQITSFQEATYVIDHQIKIDRAIIDRTGEKQRSNYETLAMTEAGELWAFNVIKGNNSTTPTVFNGLQARSAYFGRNIDNAAGVAGGAALSLTNMDKIMQRTNKPTHWIFPFDMKYRLMTAARNTTVTGHLIHASLDEEGRVITSYAGLPILFGYEQSYNVPILPFTEVATGGGAAVTSSIYCVNFSDMGVHGIQIKPLTIEDYGLMEDRVTMLTHLSWDSGIVDAGPFSFTRLSGITNAAIVS
jgi:hypothetical protein